ncbi:hypothetical protein BRC83_08195 [Halobacteriales archaeon QS_1_68_17]|nr:MAG: hypothetical protein BRC83_08195 [Halobacteriales archaeon QS_1_68_17]
MTDLSSRKAGSPRSPNDTGRSWGHSLRAVRGRFSELVWECIDCRKRRTRKQYYENVDCTDD